MRTQSLMTRNKKGLEAKHWSCVLFSNPSNTAPPLDKDGFKRYQIAVI